MFCPEKKTNICAKTTTICNIAPMRNTKPGQKSIVALKILLKIRAFNEGQII